MKKLLSTTVGALALMAYSSAAFSAFEGLSMMRIGDWEVDYSGNVNAFYTFVECDGTVGSPVVGGVACGSNGTDYDVNDVRTGLLPSWFNFYAVTETDSGIRTAIHLSFQPGVESNNANSPNFDSAFGMNDANFRQVFLTFGNDEMGTFKLGRDLGIYGGDAILNDMTLLGVGTVSDGTTGGANTSLGRIGTGYIYADWKAQIQYASPSYDGFSFTVAVTDPWSAGINADTQGMNPVPLIRQEQDTPGFEGKVNYSGQMDDVDLSLWAGFIYQSIDFALVNIINQSDLDATGWDIGAKISSGPATLVGYYYSGEGIGTTGFLSNAVGIGGNGQFAERDSDGFYIQGTVVLPDTGTKLGISYGESSLDLVAGEVNPNLVDTNESWIVGVYHPLGEALSLVAEYTNTEAQAQAGHKAEEDVFALGAIMFF